jgi:hypothetical protein
MLETSRGWVGMWATEASEVLFFDRYRVEIGPDGMGRAEIEPVFAEVCANGTIEPFSMVPETVRVNGRHLTVAGPPGARVLVTLAGVRKGMPGRFMRVSEERARRNNAFWNQAWK